MELLPDPARDYLTEHLEFKTMLTLSTAHISREDNELLGKYARREKGMIGPPMVDEFSYGWIIWLGDAHCEEDCTEVKVSGFSDGFCLLLRFALSTGAGVLVIDRDGDIVECLQKFEW